MTTTDTTAVTVAKWMPVPIQPNHTGASYTGREGEGERDHIKVIESIVDYNYTVCINFSVVISVAACPLF